MPKPTRGLPLPLIVALVAVSACQKGADKSDELYDSTKTQPANAPISVSPADKSYTIVLPPRWSRIFRVDSLSSAERGTARAGALNIVYLPRDTTQLPQTLMVVAVYDSIAWHQLKVGGGPPPGDSVATTAGRVYVLSLPQSNPFLPGSADAAKFDSLALTAAERASLLKVHVAGRQN